MNSKALLIEYCGAGFCGMQRQLGIKTIQGEVELALSSLFNESITITYAGRTDSGVSAYGQVIGFCFNNFRSDKEIIFGTNFYLQNSIKCIGIANVPNDFHARFDAIRRTYVYKIINRGLPLVIGANTHMHVSQPLNLEAMRTVATKFVGKHNFSLFRSSECQAISPIKTLERITIVDSILLNGDIELEIFVSAKSFLHNMVRRIVGTLVAVGTGVIKVNDIEGMLDGIRPKSGIFVAPAHGLYFLKVDYKNEILFYKS